MTSTPSPKQKFIDTARELFAERGYFGVSLADVAGELALTKQSVLYHFKTKDALYGAVIADIASRFDVIIDEVMDESESAPRALALFLERMQTHMQV
ncbi:MAG: helix-turn-helix transcriptional regulator, partial [Alphaproteobacteria bacterium]|nr:helix-turn-helix transcriptional regulator [Alphaproteobacteria bacterium]